MPKVICVDRRDEIAARLKNPSIAGRGYALVWLPKQPNSMIEFCSCGNDTAGVIRRAVIDN
jgi:hypothetical protein